MCIGFCYTSFCFYRGWCCSKRGDEEEDDDDDGKEDGGDDENKEEEEIRGPKLSDLRSRETAQDG